MFSNLAGHDLLSRDHAFNERLVFNLKLADTTYSGRKAAAIELKTPEENAASLSSKKA